MYKPNEIVRIRKDLIAEKAHNEFVVVDEEQLDFAGQAVTIDTYYEEFDGYVIKEDDGMFLWHADMFEEVV